MRDLLSTAILAGLAGSLVGVVMALWLGHQHRRTYQRVLVREHQRAVVLEVLHVLRLLERAAVTPSGSRDQHIAACREQQAQLRRVEDQLLVAPLSAELVGRARAALEAAEHHAALGARAVLDRRTDLVRESLACREEFVSAARRELRLRGGRRPQPVEPGGDPAYAPRRALT